MVSGRLQSPGLARWVMYLGAQISESLFDGVLPEKAAVYERWIQKLEQELRVTSDQDLTNDEVQNGLSCQLEVGFLRLRLKYDFHVLKLLRKCAPIFLQLIFSDPALWLHGHNPAAVSVSHVLSSTRYELGHFVFLDTFCAMVYALPTTVEYDTSCPPFETKIHPLEWLS
ncbi:hypothetical protein BDV93DRAFT_506324 [Ceratobasidium sp. AG-I]|nr:hypothetical protein BDV93DRAFT_506324 [Ceratobasidium sp. AG-I]